MERMEWISIIQNTVLQMLTLIIPPQWCSFHIGDEVAFGFILKGCFRILPDFTHPRIDLFFVYYAEIFLLLVKHKQEAVKSIIILQLRVVGTSPHSI